MSVTILGLATCDTCRKARRALPDASFRDIRAEPLDKGEIDALVDTFGEKLINRASRTWRELDDTSRSLDPTVLIHTHPAVMKRPVIRSGEAVYLGWTPQVRADLGVV